MTQRPKIVHLILLHLFELTTTLLTRIRTRLPGQVFKLGEGFAGARFSVDENLIFL